MVIEQFLDYLRHERAMSPHTVANYARDLEAFAAFVGGMEEGLSPLDADADIIRDWMESMIDAGSAPASVSRRLSALHAFYRYAMRRGLVDVDPSHLLRAPKGPRPLPKYVREIDMDRLLDGEGMWGEGFKDVRDRTILMTFYETGVRLSELTGLDDAAVDFAAARIKVTGKRNKQRLVPFGRELGEALRGYAELRDACVERQCGAVFVTDKGLRMNADQVRYVVRKAIARVATMQKRSPHVLRHTFATAMLNHGADIRSVQALLGHESVETTQIYTHTTFEQLKKAYKQALDRA